LGEILELEVEPRRIECFDISNIQGSDIVASMVVFEDGLPKKSDYRKFKVRTVTGAPDDFASMREVVGRRYKRLLEEGKDLPDLVLIDGGKGQLGSALSALEELGLGSQPVASLAKREEVLFVPLREEPIVLSRTSPVLQLVQRIRDEAHRFAITFHRQRRAKRTLHSELDDIPGIGPQKRKRLLSHFGSLKGVRKASDGELARVVGPAIAARIRSHFKEGVS
jgi:excinuclease ABC subunit C